jgi:NADH dehydrogenase
VAIVRAGFGGLWAARRLSRHPVEVLLIDRHNYHSFLPLLYQVAATELNPEEIACPVRSILWKLPNLQFVLADVKRVDTSRRVL